MKKWLGFLVAGIMVAISVALTRFAEAYSVLVDMVYPYMTRLVVTYMAKFTADKTACVWQTGLVVLGLVFLALLIVSIIRRGDIIRWAGWVLAAVATIYLLNTVVYGLNQYASPIADDVALEMNDYTVSELNEAALFFRDKANDLAYKVARDSKGKVDPGEFEEVAEQAGEGYKVLTYDKALSVFAGSTVPVKKLGFASFFKGKMGYTVAITGEAAVNPKVPSVLLPFAVCYEMAHRMSIYSDADTAFAAFLAASSNPDPEFQYAAYLMAYNYCYTALKEIPTSSAKTSATVTHKGVKDLVLEDLEICDKYLGKAEAKNNRAPISAKAKDENSPLRFSEYKSVVDLLTNWYIKYYILPLHIEEEIPFNPMDPTQVDLTGLVNAK